MPICTFSFEIGCAFRCLKMFGVCCSHVSRVNYGFPENEQFLEKLIKLQHFWIWSSICDLVVVFLFWFFFSLL